MGFPRQEYWVWCRFLLEEIFLTQGWNPCLLHLLHWQVDSYPVYYQGSPGDIFKEHPVGQARRGGKVGGVG